MDVFVDVDVQRDFCEPSGALAVPGAPNDTYRRLTQFAQQHRIPIVGSVDSHAFDAWEFASNDNRGPDGEDPKFPDHCVKGTTGWLKVEGTLPQRFRFVPNAASVPAEHWVNDLASGVAQAVYFEKEVYSFFANPCAAAFLAALAAKRGDEPRWCVYGVATDYCVRAAALGLAERGYRTVLVSDAVAGITDEGVQAALAEMDAAGVGRSTVADLLRETRTAS